MSSNLCASKWHALYRIENTSEIKEATNGQQSRCKVCQVSYLLGSTLPSTAQGHLRTNRTFTILPHQLKNTSQAITRKMVDPSQTPVNIKRYQVSKRSIWRISQVLHFTSLTTTDRSVTGKVGDRFSQWRVGCLVRWYARQLGCAN